MTFRPGDELYLSDNAIMFVSQVGRRRTGAMLRSVCDLFDQASMNNGRYGWIELNG